MRVCTNAPWCINIQFTINLKHIHAYLTNTAFFFFFSKIAFDRHFEGFLKTRCIYWRETAILCGLHFGEFQHGEVEITLEKSEFCCCFLYIYLHETVLRNPSALLTVPLHCYYYFSHSCHSHHRPQIGEHASPALTFITSFLLTFPIPSFTHPFLLDENQACRGWHGQSLMGVQILSNSKRKKAWRAMRQLLSKHNVEP